MKIMAEATRRSFDLKSSQGLTEVLKIARESNLSPTAYGQFRDLVLRYAQERGTDVELKKRIENSLLTFLEKKSAPPESTPPITETKHTPSKRLHGRRIVPTFMPTSLGGDYESNDEKIEQPLREKESEERKDPAPATKEGLQDPVPHVAAAQIDKEVSPKSVADHRTRILEIKRRVNSLFQNPIALVDHGNHIGREYMVALLAALKATNPGATHALEPAMAALEDSFQKVIEYSAHSGEETSAETEVGPKKVDTPAVTVDSAPLRAENPVNTPREVEDMDEATVSSKQAVSEADVPEPEVPPPPPVRHKTLPISHKNDETAPQAKGGTHADDRWSEKGGDVRLEEQIRVLREKLKERTPELPKSERVILRPTVAIVDEEEFNPLEPIEERREAGNESLDPELATQSVNQRSRSNTTGITLGTPQTELMSVEVTAALTELLEEWNIFASSGIFGMGPGGIAHPLYVQLAHLPMGEVLSGRFNDSDMKTVRTIKDYIDAWRHEQGVAYNPTETFEHYLRRIAKRILARQNAATLV